MNNSDYIITDATNWSPDNNRNAYRSKAQVLDSFDEGTITYSDLYIVYIIHVMTYATYYQIMDYAKWWTKYNKDLPLIIGNEQENFKSRLYELTKNSFIRRYTFTTSAGDKRACYHVTPHGYNFIKKKLYFSESYDEFLGAAPHQEIFKYLSNNEVLLKILKKTTVSKNYSIQSSLIYESHVQFFNKAKRKNIITYGFVKISKGDEKIKLLLEPYRRSFQSVFIEADMLKIQEERFEFIDFYIQQYMAANKSLMSLKIVFVCEDLSGVKSLAKKILQTYSAYTYDTFYITIDKEIEKNGISKTFYQLKKSEGEKDKHVLSFITGSII